MVREMSKKKLKRDINDNQETRIKSEFENLSFTVVLVQPEYAGNIGSIARVMGNFDFNRLVIFNPIEEIDKIKSYMTQGYAMHGKDILLGAKIVDFEDQENHINKFKGFMKNFDLIIATTAKGKHFRNIKRTAIFPENLSLPISNRKLEVAIVFGKESRGLTNAEIEIADIILRIPTGNVHPTMNLSHACGVILYEIFNKTRTVALGRGENPISLAGREEREVIYNLIKSIITQLKVRDYKEKRVFLAFKNILERALITKKEMSLIMGVFSKIDSILKKMDPYSSVNLL